MNLDIELENETENGIKGDAKVYDEKVFDEKIDSINRQFFSVLDDFKKYYVYFNKNPEVDEFQNYYSNSKSQLQSLSQSIRTTTQTINNNIDLLSIQMSEISEKIQREKDLYEKLTLRLKNLENTQNGSEILVDDSKMSYNSQYYKNWELFIGIIVITTLIFKIYKVPVKE